MGGGPPMLHLPGETATVGEATNGRTCPWATEQRHIMRMEALRGPPRAEGLQRAAVPPRRAS